MEICITTIFEGTKSGEIVWVSQKNSLIPFRKGHISYNFKNNKHKKLANDNGYAFLPVIMESPTGRLDQKFERFTKRNCEEECGTII